MHWIVALTTFLGASVEWIEALTLVLAAGITVGWRPALRGSAVGFLVLGAIVTVLGVALTRLAVLTTVLQLVVGLFLALFGIRWLAKATLRSAGVIPRHDEQAAFEREVAAIRAVEGGGRTSVAPRAQREAFALSFQGVLLEGLEVAFIVVAFGATTRLHAGSGSPLWSAVLGAVVAFVLVALVGLATHRPLSRVPENTLKYAVGLMLTSFGVFWLGEGIGVTWPGRDLTLVGLVVLFFGLTRVLAARYGRTREEGVGVA